jgi:prepilin-type N-terminal cleavage/methylation domain-containing protein
VSSRHSTRAFTLIEMLTVIAIIGVLAAIMAPTLKNFRQNDATLSATRQLLDAVARARQFAISQRTTVYLVFVPPGFWNSPAYVRNNALTFSDRSEATNLVDKQLTGYNFVALRSVGDQPGHNYPRYLSTWETLPESTFIALDKFTEGRARYNPYLYDTSGFKVFGFDTTTNIPFPLATTQPWIRQPGSANDPYPSLPYIAFDYLGRLVSGQDEFIPLAKGGVLIAHDANGLPAAGAAPLSVSESPPGNSTNSYNLIHIDWLTGRARLEHRQVQ